jgi:hypothetical protein
VGVVCFEMREVPTNVMRFNINVSDGNRLFVEFDPTSAFLTYMNMSSMYEYIAVHNVQCISVRVS